MSWKYISQLPSWVAPLPCGASQEFRSMIRYWFFSLSKHVQNVCKSYVQLHHFRHVRRFLTHDASVLVASALVSSRLDYCNSLFRSLSEFNLHKLQCLQISAARIISNTSRYASITPVFKKLHLLPVEHRSVFKTATLLVYKFLHTGFPRYFDPYISSYSSSYSTRHSQSGGNIFVLPKFQPSIHKSVKQFGYSFAFDAPIGMLFLMRFVRPLPTLFQKAAPTYLYTHLSLTHPLAFSVVLGLFSVPGYWNWLTALVLLHLRVPSE